MPSRERLLGFALGSLTSLPAPDGADAAGLHVVNDDGPTVRAAGTRTLGAFDFLGFLFHVTYVHYINTLR